MLANQNKPIIDNFKWIGDLNLANCSHFHWDKSKFHFNKWLNMFKNKQWLQVRVTSVEGLISKKIIERE